MANQIGGNIVWNLDVDDSKFKAGLSRAKEAADNLGKDVDDKFSSIQNSVTKSFENATKGSYLFAAGLAAVGAGLVAASGFGIKYAADLETMTQGFITLLGSADKANEAISMIQKDAAKTPFTFKGLVDANLLLTSVTKNAQRSEGLLLNIGKALTAAGKSGTELDRVIINLQQIANVGKITELDIRQFGFAGINILELLADFYGTTKEAAVEMVKNSKDAFKDLEGAFLKAGENGGRFSRAFIDQAGTLNQVWSNFQDNLGITASELVKQTGLFDAVKDALKRLTDGLAFFASPEGTQQLLSFFEAIKQNAPIVIGFIVGGLTPAFVALAGSIWATFAPLLPFIAAGVAIGAVVQLVVNALGGWTEVMIHLQNALKLAGQAYNTYLKPGIDELAQEIKSNLLPALQQLWTQLQPVLIPALKLLGVILGGAILGALTLFIQYLRFSVEATTAVVQALSTFITFVQGLPARISAAWSALTVSFTNAVNAIIAAVANLPTTISNAIAQMILDLAFFVGFVVGIFIYGIPAAITATINALVALPGQVATTFTNIYTAVTTWMTLTWQRAVVLANQIVEGISTWFRQLPETTKVTFNTMLTTAIDTLKNMIAAIIAELRTWPARLYEWGANIANAFVDGVKSAIGNIVNAFKDGLNKAKSVIQGKSPPIEGPFKEVDVWGYNVGTAWVEGVQKAISALTFDNPMLSPLPAPAPAPAFARGGRPGIEKLVNIERMDVRQESDITDVARELGFRIENSPGFTQ